MISNRFSHSKWLAIILVPFLLIQCKNTEKISQQAGITSTQHYIPVLKGEQNLVAELTLELEEEKELSTIVLKMDGWETIDTVNVYYTGNGEELSNKQAIAAVSDLGETIEVQVDRKLSPGKHHLWVSLTPKTTADLTKEISLDFNNISLGKDEIWPVATNSFRPLRLATSLRDHGDDGVHSFRIPGLATTAKGTLIAVYDARWNNSADLQGDIDVGMSRSVDGGKTWEPMKIIMDMKKWGGQPEQANGIGDPAVLVDPETNTIWVAGLWLHGKPDTRAWNSSAPGMSPEETGQLVLVKSEDDGKSWSAPINITSQVKKPEWQLMFNGPGKGITMKDGTLVFAAQFKDKEEVPYSTIIYSKDKGKTWHVGTGAKSNTTEAQVVELKDGSLMLNMRDNRGGARSVAVTHDHGKTWTEHSSSRKALPEPVCMASIITHDSGKYAEEEAPLLFFSNPATTEGRYNITVKASTDQGKTWPEEYHLLLDAKKNWGYSCLTSIDENHLGILYESSQANMTFQIIPIEDIMEE